ncbi:MAG: glucosidase [Phycisphaeraceae bacterium]|nr:glucosidase [Phycisphaeraceae bacterium]
MSNQHPHADDAHPTMCKDPESQRLAEDAARIKNWKRWGPYLSERQWGTVREDYSPNGDCWNYLLHDHARSRAYRWGEDGILGLTDRECRLCFALAMWNGKDPIIKERLFGLTGPEGNHGEDVKETYFFLDSTPTHSYMKGLYKYPQQAYPYDHIVAVNKGRTRLEPEYEIADTGIFDEGRYFDVQIEYAKDGGGGPDDILIRATIFNRGPDAAPLHFLPTLWCRNTWAWGAVHEGSWPRAPIEAAGPAVSNGLRVAHASLGTFRFWADAASDSTAPAWLFTENETNSERLFGRPNAAAHVKDAFNELLVHGKTDAVSPERSGTKVAAYYNLTVPAGGSVVVRMRLCAEAATPPAPFSPEFEAAFSRRKAEADEFYSHRIRGDLGNERSMVSRQAYAGLLWSKQYYNYIVDVWLKGDPAEPTPSPERERGRNSEWRQVFCRDVISMPDSWEYPWFAAWDLAFHCVAFARIDPEFAKQQLILFLREWYMHPSGQLPAYEFAFSDVNPPVHAWAVWRVYKITGLRGKRDRLFLARAFQKLLINFTWWVNRKDPNGKNLFAGGFLGLDNIGVFDRSMKLPDDVTLAQADGTAWMAFFCGTMMSIALELASEDPAYEDVASKFFEHFVAITDAMNSLGGSGLWDETDGFYYDQVSMDGVVVPMKVRSLVGVVPMLAVEVLEDDTIDRLPGFRKRMEWFLKNRTDLARYITYLEHKGEQQHNHRLLAIPSRQRLESVLRYLFDESEFLSPYGVRSVSKFHEAHPFVTQDRAGREYRVDYAPGESTTEMFGGNSNWRGPVWLPLNYLIIEALERYHHYYGDNLLVEVPVGSGRKISLHDAAHELRSRLTALFLAGGGGRRPCNGDDPRFASDPHWKDLVLFHEYFHAETGKGLGASHQTGWTALIATLLQKH